MNDLGSQRTEKRSQVYVYKVAKGAGRLGGLRRTPISVECSDLFGKLFGVID